MLWVDEQRRQVWFVAAGLVADDPYVRQICRIGLDGQGFVRLTKDDTLDHDAVSPDGGYLVSGSQTGECKLWDSSQGCLLQTLLPAGPAVQRLVAAGALVTPGKRVRRGELWAGSPAKFLRPMNDADLAMIDRMSGWYAGLAQEHMAAAAADLAAQ